MKWLDLDYPRYLLLRMFVCFQTWQLVPDKEQRKAYRRQAHREAKEWMDDALRREKWMATYENRPERSEKEVLKGLLSQLKEAAKRGTK